MARVVSRLGTAVAYQIGGDLDGHGFPVAGTGTRYELANGESIVPDEILAKMQAPIGKTPDGADVPSEFARHVAEGWVSILPAEDAPEPVAVQAAPEDPARARKPKESDKAYKARMDALDAQVSPNKEADDKMVAEYLMLTTEERAALREALDPREQALVDQAAANV